MVNQTANLLLNPYTESNLISKCFFIWCRRYLNEVNGAGATAKMLFPPKPEDQAQKVTDKLIKQIYTDKSYRKVKLNIYVMIWKFFDRSDFVQWFLIAFLCEVILRVFTTMLLSYALTQLALLDPHNKYDNIGVCLLAIFYILLLFLMSLLRILRHFWGICYGQRLSVGLTGLIYDKITKLPQRILTNEKVNELIEIIFLDLRTLTELPLCVQNISMAMIIFLTSMLLMYAYFGTACLFGLAVYFFVATPVQIVFAYITFRMETTLRAKRSRTVAIVTDVFAGIDTIKTSCLSDIFIRILERAYGRELYYSWRLIFPQVVLWSASTFWHRVGVLTTIIIYYLQGNILTVGQAMICIIVYEHFCTYFLVMIANAVQVYMRSSYVLAQIQEFLRLTEDWHNLFTPLDKWEIHFLNVSTAGSARKTALKDVTLRIPAGKLTVICGAENSGCFSIMPVLISEVRVQSGEVRVGGALSYYFKNGLLVDGTIKRNITLGRKFDKHQYKLIKKLCGLYSELKYFPDGDDTLLEVSAYWPSLQQKVLLARTLYAIANIYIFDQPAMQVLNSVERLIFEDAITKYLKGITRLVVSNQDVYLKQADKIYFFQDGYVKARGTYREIRRAVRDFELIVKHGTDAPHENTRYTMQVPAHLSNKVIGEKLKITASLFKRFKERKRFIVHLLLGRHDGQLAGLLFIFMFLTGLAPFIAKCFLFTWSTRQLVDHYNYTLPALYTNRRIHHESSVFQHSFSDFLAVTECRVFFYIVASMMLLISIQYWMVAAINLKRVSRMYKSLVNNLLRKTLSYFYQSSLIRLQEVLSNDIYTVQECLSKSFIGIVYACSITTSALGVIAFVNYYLAAVLVIYVIICIYMCIWFKKTCRRMLRLEHDIRFPIVTHIMQTKNLLTMLRCCEMMDQRTKLFYSLVNKHTTAAFMLFTLKQAFRVWLTLLTIFVTLIVIIVYGLLYIKTKKYLDEINIVMYILTVFTLYVNVGVDDLFSVMYLHYYTKRIAQQNETDLEDTESGLRYPKIWIKAPSIRFSRISGPEFGYVTTFRSLHIAAGQHIGLIGRSGSGRRVIVKMLLRLYPHVGTIKVAHKKVNDLNVCTLRRNIFYISLNTALFAPSLRFNLDPRNEFTDSILWSSLNVVGLTADIISLEDIVHPMGANIPLEQKILILLARALLLQSKVVIIDHIFEQISREMQDFIEDIIYQEFANCTLIFIESRLNYVVRCDRVVVFDRGRIMDDDKPAQIYENRTNFLHTIVDKTGYVDENKLHKIRNLQLEDILVEEKEPEPESAVEENAIAPVAENVDADNTNSDNHTNNNNENAQSGQ